MTPTLFLLLFLANVASTWFMVGLIWFVQLVHYPQFAAVGAEAFVAYHRRHTRFTTWVVAAPMLIEAATSLYLAIVPPAAVDPWIPRIGLAMLALVWLSTWLLQVPRHHQLAVGFDARACGRLCGTNWIRTFAWTVRGLLVLVMLARAMGTAS
jgi:hypothetical protein